MRQTELRGRKMIFMKSAGSEGAGFQQGANYRRKVALERSIKIVNSGTH